MRQSRLHMHTQGKSLLFRIGPIQFECLLDRFPQIELGLFNRQFARFDLGNVENVVEQCQKRVGGIIRNVAVFFLLFS